MNGFSLGHDWPWLGGAAALLLLYLLLGTTRLQADPAQRRWRDRTWLAWAAVFSYLAHNVEEYGIDLLGRSYEFPRAMSDMFGGTTAPPPNSFYLAVNLCAVWLAMPVAALVSRRHPLVGLAGYSVMAVNLITHVGAFIAAGYNPGFATAVGLFLPMTIWMATTLFGEGRMPYPGLAAVIAAGIVVHAVLMGSMIAYINGLMPSGALVAFQVFNAVLLLVVLWTAERALLTFRGWRTS